MATVNLMVGRQSLRKDESGKEANFLRTFGENVGVIVVKTVGEFVDLVEKMREAQKQYFRSRSTTDLNCSKKLEKCVDETIEQYRKRKEEKTQPGLDLQ